MEEIDIDYPNLTIRPSSWKASPYVIDRLNKLRDSPGIVPICIGKYIQLYIVRRYRSDNPELVSDMRILSRVNSAYKIRICIRIKLSTGDKSINTDFHANGEMAIVRILQKWDWSAEWQNVEVHLGFGTKLGPIPYNGLEICSTIQAYDEAWNIIEVSPHHISNTNDGKLEKFYIKSCQYATEPSIAISCQRCRHLSPDIVFMPCMHAVYCTSCSKYYGDVCPICANKITHILQVYYHKRQRSRSDKPNSLQDSQCNVNVLPKNTIYNLPSADGYPINYNDTTVMSHGDTVITCAICLNDFANIVALPCRHVYCCHRCDASLRIATCPCCRTDIDGRICISYVLEHN